MITEGYQLRESYTKVCKTKTHHYIYIYTVLIQPGLKTLQSPAHVLYAHCDATQNMGQKHSKQYGMLLLMCF